MNSTTCPVSPLRNTSARSPPSATLVPGGEGPRGTLTVTIHNLAPATTLAKTIVLLTSYPFVVASLVAAMIASSRDIMTVVAVDLAGSASEQEHSSVHPWRVA